jgi:hypothetical protein
MRFLVCLHCRFVCAVRETAGICECPKCGCRARVTNLAIADSAVNEIIDWVAGDPHMVDSVLDRIRVSLPGPAYPRRGNDAPSP